MLKLSKSEIARLSKKTVLKKIPIKTSNKKLSENELEDKKKERVRKIPRQVGGGNYQEISFCIKITPRPKERARTYVDKSVLINAFRYSCGDIKKFIAKVMSGLMKTVTPESTRIYERSISSQADMEMKKQNFKPFSVPVFMYAIFVFPGLQEEWPVAHPDGDLDNLEKALLDGLNKVVWEDDRLVVKKISYKICGPEPMILVKVFSASGALLESKVLLDFKVLPENLLLFTNCSTSTAVG